MAVRGSTHATGDEYRSTTEIKTDIVQRDQLLIALGQLKDEETEDDEQSETATETA